MPAERASQEAEHWLFRAVHSVFLTKRSFRLYWRAQKVAQFSEERSRLITFFEKAPIVDRRPRNDHSIAPLRRSRSCQVLLVFDVAHRSSFADIEVWLKAAQEQTPPSSVKVLIGNKTDFGDARTVLRTEAEAFAEKMGLTYFETSALSGDGIEDAFMDVAKKVQRLITNGTI
jgi:GTPase SAR1 family protein